MIRYFRGNGMIFTFSESFLLHKNEVYETADKCDISLFFLGTKPGLSSRLNYFYGELPLNI